MNRPDRIVLLDNGSLQPAATLNLRRLAAAVGARLGREVDPVSLLHSSKVDPALLEGRPADTWRRYVKRERQKGARNVLALPLFFGPSSAIADYLPQVTSELCGGESGFLRIAKTLVDVDDPGDDAVARLLSAQIEWVFERHQLPSATPVLLVDHGSPVSAVTRCRDRVAEQIKDLLRDKVGEIRPCSMERRPEPEYDFNEPILTRALAEIEEAGEAAAALCYLFLSPGRHAGPGGDIDKIVASSTWAQGGGQLFRCPLAGESPAIVEILERRARDAGL